VEGDHGPRLGGDLVHHHQREQRRQVGDRDEKQTLRAKNFVIATGSRTAVPKIDGIESVRYFTNETIFDELDEKPESLVVLGGGPIGCELGQTFRRFGVRVTIVQRKPVLGLRGK